MRTIGPLLALVPPAVVGVVALGLLRDSTTATTGVAGFVLAVLAAPLLPVLGAPLRSGTGLYLLAAAGSAAVWLVLGAMAAVRATRDPRSGWGRFWGELGWMVLCVWVGVALAVLATNLVLGRLLV